MEMFSAAKARGMAVFEQGMEKFNSAKQQVFQKGALFKEQAVKSTRPFLSRFEKLVSVGKSAKATALDVASIVKENVLSTASKARITAETARSDIKSKGVKAWAFETAHVGREYVSDAAVRTAAKGKELYATGSELASQKSFQTAAASAATGAVALGAGGGATGLTAGGALGAAAGVPFALFTFGLSIPVGAAIGGGAGLAVGAATGATAGLVGGGAAGYGAYAKKDDFFGAASQALTKAGDGAEIVKGKAYASVGYMKDAVTAARARVLGAGTGSTAD